MIKAILASKWYWYIPIFSLIYIHAMSKWVFEADKEIDRGWRMIVVDFSIFPHVIAIIILLMKFNILHN